MPTDTAHTDTIDPDLIELEIKLPKTSFTSFRFLYGNAQEISQVSNVTLLGSIPKLWYREQNSSFVKTWTKASYSKFQKTVKDVGNIINARYRVNTLDIHKDPTVRKFLSLTRQSTNEEYDGTALTAEEDEEEDDGYQVADVALPDNKQNERGLHGNEGKVAATHVLRQNSNGCVNESKSKKGVSKTPVEPQSPVPEYHKTQPLHKLSPDPVPIINVDTELPSGSNITTQKGISVPESSNQTFHSAAQIGLPFETEESKNLDSSGVLSSSTTATGTIKPITPQSHRTLDRNSTIPTTRTPSRLSFESKSSAFSSINQQNVRFDNNNTAPATSSGGKKKSTQFLRPEPDENPIILPLDPRHERALDRIRAIATRTKKHVRRDIQTTKQRRIFQKFLRNYKVGEIIKMEKMLILVKQTINSNNMAFTSFTEMEPCDTRVLKRWREYIVVARSTGDFHSPILIQFYTKHEIPHDENSKHTDDELDFQINKNCLVNFYSSLDKTIAIVNRGKVYVMRCQTPNSSIRWFAFLQEVLGHTNSRILRIQIPKISITINIKITATLIDKLLNEEERQYSSLIFKPNGYYAKELPALEYLLGKIKTKLIKAGYHDLVENWNKQSPVLAFCWRHYDRLEWIFGETLSDLFWQQSMYSTHDLELRASQHYPHTVETGDKKIREPSPIEGFLARLSTRHGSHRNMLFQQVFKFSYFYTNNHMLFFCRSYKALPPHPGFEHLSNPEFFVNPANYDEIKAQIPQIYDHNPYKIDSNGHITWLKPEMTMEEFQQHDQFASYEYERRVSSIVRADAVINLLDVDFVESVDPELFATPVRIASNFAWEGDTDLNDESEESKNSFFQLVLRDGAIFTLKASNKFLRDEWIVRLTELVEYWKLRIEEDVKIIRDMKFENISRLNIDDYMEANVGEATPKWENSRGVADPLVHNISSNAMFRPVVRSGMLFQKPKKHSVFKNYFVCLVPGYIILYKVLAKDVCGALVPTTHYKHYLTIPLDECYIYSGKTSSIDLLNRRNGTDNVNLGKDSLPRIYEDGWMSSEDEASRCFTLWFGTKRAISGKMMKNSNESFNDHGSKNPGIVRMVSRLGVTGKSMVFMCRSRQERDLWVSNLYTEVERFHKQTFDFVQEVQTVK